ncbi:MAG: hypothetical protein E7235_04005 [Lachnospiraceae bacterium]|nr:hypothetical protein [Lachnospiraceae bacterium]
MIEAVEAYIENIVGLMIVTALAEMIMPESSFKKYARLITGLVIIAAVAEPAIEIIYGRGLDFEFKEVYSAQNADEQRKIVNDIYIKSIENSCDLLAEENGIEISDIKINSAGERIDGINIHIETPHSCVEEVMAYDEDESVCAECEEAVNILRKEIKGATGLEKVDVIILKERR